MIPGGGTVKQLNHRPDPPSPKVLDVLVLAPVVSPSWSATALLSLWLGPILGTVRQLCCLRRHASRTAVNSPCRGRSTLRPLSAFARLFQDSL